MSHNLIKKENEKLYFILHSYSFYLKKNKKDEKRYILYTITIQKKITIKLIKQIKLKIKKKK